MYQEIAANKRKTSFLFLGMGGAILGLATLLGMLAGGDVWSSLFLGTLITGGYSWISYFFSDSIALHVSGAKAIEKQDAPELFRIVENLAIAKGLPTPAIYIIHDDSPNAFATGRDPEHASVAFTTGLLAMLDKRELEGVAAHELSHIANYDIRVMTIAAVLVGALMLLGDFFLRGGFSRERKDEFSPLFFIGIALAILSPILGEIIKLAISREREFLADASGALLTRYPEGLASALEKIHSAQTPLAHAHQATAHLFIANPFQGSSSMSWIAKLFATHPPAEERIARLRSLDRS